MHILIYLYVCIYFPLSFLSKFPMFLSTYVRWKPRLLLRTIGRSALQLEEKGFSCFAKEGKKKRVSHNLCMKIYGKRCCLVKINIHMASKGIYFVVWNIQVIDLKKKRRNCTWTQRQTWKTNAPSPHKPPKIQDLHVLGGGVIHVVR
jgi:hypothetical protein